MKRSRRNLPIGYRPEEPPANESDGLLPASLLNGCSVCYWTDTACVTERPHRLLCLVEHHRLCVIFATLQNLFLSATVQDNFSVWMSRIYYKWGVPS